MRAVIFANGNMRDQQGMRALLSPDDVIIAADGGTQHVLTIGLVPHIVIGDLDSVSSETEARMEAGGAHIERFSPRKDETDLELALKYAAAAGASEIIVLAALGGRLDQTIANLLLLALPELEGIDVRVVEGAQEAFLIQAGPGVDIEGQLGDTLSLIPLGGDAVGVTAEGVEWALNDDTLCFGLARGVSNVLTAERAHVEVREGLLLCVVIRAE